MPSTRERRRIRGQHPANAPEFAHQRLGERLGVGTGNRDGEEIFDQLVIEQRLSATLEQPLAQPRPVPLALVDYIVCPRHGRMLAHPAAIA